MKFDFLGLKTLTVLKRAVDLIARRGIAIDLGKIPLDDREDLRDARARRDGRRVPGGKRRHAQGAGRHARRPVRGPDRAGRALPPGPDGEHSRLLRAQARPGKGRIRPSAARADPQGDLRRHHLSGAGACRSRRTSPAIRSAQADILRRAMGKKIKKEMDAQRERFVNGAVERGIDQRDRRRDFRRLRQIRRIRLQQVTFRALRADHLPDRPGSRPTIRPNSSPPR